MVVRVRGEGQVRQHGAQVQHGRQLDAQLARRVDGHAELERLADAGRLDAGANPSPERGVEQDDVTAVWSTLAASCSNPTTTVLVASGIRIRSRVRRIP